MEDFNNIEFDPIPEGLEFNESYMQDAFALYDAEKQKQRRRILIWWLTSALGFASILLVGIYFFTKENASDSAEKKTRIEKGISAQNKAAKNASSSVESKNQITQPVIAANRNASYNPVKTGGIDLKKRTAFKFSTSSKHHTTENHTPEVSKKMRNSFKNKRTRTKIVAAFETDSMNHTIEANTIAPASVHLMTQPVTPDNLNQRVETDFSQFPDLDTLPSKPVLLAFNQDSLVKRTIDSLGNFTQVEVQPRKHQLFLNLGVNTMFGMKELQHRVIFKESIGISYNYQLSEKIGIGVGLEYHSIPRITYRRIVGDTTKSDKTTTILNKTTLNYISLYPQMSFHLWPHHKVTAGLGIEYLLTDPGERYEIENYTNESSKRTNSKLYYST
ncbi:hypothetical protein, partial [Fluviicola sp.]|uniref:hypothetical protein n=1 Tax=Fluviicola sp. TaxID=1917219 RepID=UPI0026252084